MMKCSRCGATMKQEQTDLPFKVDGRAIVIIRSVPVVECPNCPEYLLSDATMEQVEKILDRRTPVAELEIVQFAA